MNSIENQISWLLQEKYGGVLTESAQRDIGRIKKGEPLDYIIGFTEFLGCKIDLSKKPLIPRIETEYWVHEAIEVIRNLSSLRVKGGGRIKCLDIFAGSGCIGISVITHIKNAHVVFADSEKNALKQIKINCRLNGIDKKRHKIILSDIFSGIEGRFDFIFANPPYIPTIRKHKVRPSVLRHEPKKALFGGRDGLFYIRKFLAQAKHFLKESGLIFMEFDSIKKKEVDKLLKRYGYKKWKFYRDQYGKWRYVVVK